MRKNILMLVPAMMISNVSFVQAQTSTAAQTKPSTTAATPITVTTPSVASESLVTALCEDGSSYSGDSNKGICFGHKGVKTWTTKGGQKRSTILKQSDSTKLGLAGHAGEAGLKGSSATKQYQSGNSVTHTKTRTDAINSSDLAGSDNWANHMLYGDNADKIIKYDLNSGKRVPQKP